MKLSSERLERVGWSLAATTLVAAAVVWGQSLEWNMGGVTAYSLFPLLGLLAFSLMWTHYAVAAAQRYAGVEASRYFKSTEYAVLLLILAHPGLLFWQLWRDGLGWPPASAYKYVGLGMSATITLGAVALTAFLLFELGRWLKGRPWWWVVDGLSDLGMLVIVLHSLRLGSHLQYGWFQKVWYFYAVTLLGFLIYKYVSKLNKG